ncbi:MAG: S8 family serine peptidase [Bacteroidota bacterium]
MNRNALLCLCTLLLLFGCHKDAEQPSRLEAPGWQTSDPLTKAEIDQLIREQTKNNDIFHWSSTTDHVLWSAGMQGEQVYAIGYKPATESQIEDRIHEIDTDDAAWVASREKIIQLILEAERLARPGEEITEKDILPSEERKVLPVIIAKISSPVAIQQLRSMKDEIRYLDPIGYRMETADLRGNEGCGGASPDNINPADFQTTAPNAKIPWNYNFMNIPQAWSRSTGSGIKVALIDTGVYPNQSKLGSQFNSGYSSGRSIQKAGTYTSSWWWWARPDGPNDRCGHGTQMAGLIAAPRSTSGSSVGVAYNCNLLSIRGTGDVVIGSWREIDGVSDALVIAGNDGAVKIVSMSLGDIFYHGEVADAVRYAYNRGKMIFAAAGTSTSFTNWVGVTFPATMSETVAVTGVEDSQNLQYCNTCHYGRQVDFVAVMQRANDGDRNSITLSSSGSAPNYVGGSSAATAITAGIAALVWSTNPGMNRTTVMNKLKNAASIYPNRNSRYGWGLIDANAAVQ